MMYWYPICILHWYLLDSPWFVLREYLKIKLFFLKTIVKYFSDTSGIHKGYAVENLYVHDTWCFYYFWDICNWLSINVLFLGYIMYVIEYLSLFLSSILLVFIFMLLPSILCLFVCLRTLLLMMLCEDNFIVVPYCCFVFVWSRFCAYFFVFEF